MDYFCFTLKPHASIDSTWEHLVHAGFQLLYSSEEPDNEKHIYGYPPKGPSLENLLHSYPEIASIHPVQFDQIDWQAQWGSENSSITIDLKEYCNGLENKFLMHPGPGFGDLSHPTTQLVLRMMAPLTEGKFVIDLGCGSGVLSLAAIKLGAIGACGIDIDPEALSHAKKNALLNGIEEKIAFQLPTEPLFTPPDVPVLLVMNMIYTEQEQAWNALPQLHALKMDCITSGILRKQQKIYLAQCQRWGWREVKHSFEEKWCGFHFVTYPTTK